MTSAILPSRIRSGIVSPGSDSLATWCTLMPICCSARAVPSVEYTVKPALTSCCAIDAAAGLSRSLTVRATPVVPSG